MFLFISIFGISQNPDKNYTATRTNTEPRIDGVLDDDTWQNVTPITDFIQRTPVENAIPSQFSEVKLVYDDNAIYVAAMYYDTAPDSIYRELGTRDNSQINADQFYIGFDTYNLYDAYVFGINASGVQLDYKDSDPSYDAVWESDVKINDKGWAIEMRIPYSAIRFPSDAEQSWGFQIIRTIPRNQEYNQWALTPRTVSNSRLLWGKLNGLSNIQAPIRLSVTPFVNFFYENSPSYDINESNNNSYSYNAGADLKYGIDEKFTLDLTLLPDFSQVQSDNKVKTLGYEEVTFTENRTFFNEGTELFNKNNIFYSRRIGRTTQGYYSVNYELKDGEKLIYNPSITKLLNAFKISGRNNNGLGIGLFNAITDNMYATVEDSIGNQRKILTEPLTNYNVMVFDQQLKNNSNIYFINTNVIRAKKYDDANVTGTGFTLENKTNTYAIDAQFSLSQKYSKNDSIENTYSNLLGTKSFIGIRKSSGNFQFGVSNNYISPTFDSRDLGYYILGNKLNNRVYFNYNTYEPKFIFRETYNQLLFDYNINPETKKPIYSQINIGSNTLLSNYYNFGISATTTPFVTYNYYEPRVQGRYSINFRYWFVNANFNTDYTKPLYLNMNIFYGDFTERFKGENYGGTFYVQYRFSDKLQMNYNFSYNYDAYNIGFTDILDNYDIIYGGRQLTTYENIVNLQYMFINDMSLNIVSRHYWYSGKYTNFYTLQSDGDIIENVEYTQNKDFSYNAFNIDLVYSWQFAPGSTISVVYKNSIENEGDIIENKFTKNFTNTLDFPQTNSISVKLLYYLDYQSVHKVIKKI